LLARFFILSAGTLLAPGRCSLGWGIASSEGRQRLSSLLRLARQLHQFPQLERQSCSRFVWVAKDVAKMSS
jgi:hypothetical protein